MKQQYTLGYVFLLVGLSVSLQADFKEIKEKTENVVKTVAAKTTAGLQSTKATIATSAQTVKNYFSDPALGSVYYYANMAIDAQPVKETIPGSFAINAFYYKFYPKMVRQWLQKQGTHVEFNNWWRKISKWYQEETGEYDGADIKKFVAAHKIDMTDYEKEDAAEYEDFNHFFYRTLKNGVRKIDTRQEVVVSPADCKLRVLSNISANSKFFIKQAPFNLVTFLHDASLAAQYEGGTLMTFRLAPTDYHRFHFPFDCTPSAPVLIKGEYETVSPIAFRAGLWPISTNKRARITLSSPIFGDVIMMVVGACMIASLNFTYTPGQSVEKGSEAGYFAFGGSTICLLFKKGVVTLPDVLVNRSEHKEFGSSKKVAAYEKSTAFETAVRMGQGVAVQVDSVEADLLSDPRYITFLNKTNKEMALDLDGIKIVFEPNLTIRGKQLIGF
jgi:phosphatidylserine decarboxylase